MQRALLTLALVRTAGVSLPSSPCLPASPKTPTVVR